MTFFCFPKVPIEMLELLLMRSFVGLFRVHRQQLLRNKEVTSLIFSSLAAVSSSWWNTLCGWPESPTKNWLKRKLRRLISGLYSVSVGHRQLLSFLYTFDN